MTELNERSKQIRRDAYHLSKANGGYHYGGSFSCVEILIALFDHVMNRPFDFILSKGHSCWPYYVLLREAGFDPKLEGHPSRDPVNGILATTGSLGHGLPIGVGMALARKMNNKSGQIYVLMGDGECQEGTTWESMQIAGKHELGNLTVIVDHNKIQGSGFINDILIRSGDGQNVDTFAEDLYTISDRLGWGNLATPPHYLGVDGHNVELLAEQLSPANYLSDTMPHLIITNTIKGKGVSFMENKPEWHAKWPDAKHEKQLLEELV